MWSALCGAVERVFGRLLEWVDGWLLFLGTVFDEWLYHW